MAYFLAYTFINQTLQWCPMSVPILVNYDALRKVVYRICSPAHYKLERINFSKCHPKHVETEILPERQQNRGNACPEYVRRNAFPLILVHTVEETGNTVSQKEILGPYGQDTSMLFSVQVLGGPNELVFLFSLVFHICIISMHYF